MQTLTSDRLKLLRKIRVRAVTAIDLGTDRNIAIVQDLVRMGYVRDYSNHHGHRIPIRLRIWGITDPGRAVLEQESMIRSRAIGKRGQLSLISQERDAENNEPEQEEAADEATEEEREGGG